MKIIGKIIRGIIAALVIAAVIVVSCFTAVFFVFKDNPSDIFIFDYAFVAQVGEDEKIDMYFVEKTKPEEIELGDCIVYYDGTYKSANAMIGYDGRLLFADSDDLELFVSVEDEAIVGKTLALWQQK